MSKIPIPHRDYILLGGTDDKEIIEQKLKNSQLVMNVIKIYKANTKQSKWTEHEGRENADFRNGSQGYHTKTTEKHVHISTRPKKKQKQKGE